MGMSPGIDKFFEKGRSTRDGQVAICVFVLLSRVSNLEVEYEVACAAVNFWDHAPWTKSSGK